MNTGKKLLRLGLWILVATLCSCAQATSEVTPGFRFTPTLRAIGTSTTAAAETATTSPTATSIPTLPSEEAGKRFLDLLSNNGGCALPCLWGITPGKTTDQQAQVILAPLSSISELRVFKPGLGSLSPVYAEGDLWLTVNVGYLSDDQIVNRIGFRIEELRKTTSSAGRLGFDTVFDFSLFGERVNFYMLHSILTSHGRPESVMLGTVANIPPREPLGGFHILLLYPDQGILIDYTTQMHKTGAYISGCPANAHAELELYPSGNADAFYSSLEKLDTWIVKRNWYRSLEDTTSMSVEEFYETFREPTDTCIDTLASLWPKPEP
jgi:hypothetical protein